MQKLFHAIVRQSQDGIILTHEKEVVYKNKAVAVVLSGTPGEMKGFDTNESVTDLERKRDTKPAGNTDDGRIMG